MILTAWAARHSVAPVALAELRALMIGEYVFAPASGASLLSEAAVQNNARLEATRRGDRLFRNNVGVLKDERGVPVRFGLANDSAAVNKKIKSSDLIGIKRVTITPAHVGQVIGQFYAVECKPGNWKYAGTEREQAQLKFLSLVTAMGGSAHFSTGAI